jgi:HD-GYP domain-containing protein (c-di-GMP phosphodiesterase class II)
MDRERHLEQIGGVGARILIGCDVHPFYVETVLHHHESWNGRGYPVGLKGEEIPLSARMLAIADVYDVLTSQRPYKAPLTMKDAKERLMASSGTNFDPIVLQAFVDLMDATPNFTLAQGLCSSPLKEMQQSPFYNMFITGS